ncbi:protein NUCLEAR FUSION DEFECTIVE 6, chloroplastic/mitochondrial-like isoform X2 [Ananas comosus]|uniref:Protein NUCLEAR FUSION DEFECTIVE 6, chloroplastic/mitochondrial-like isoform X2 n=1 Tax=Ananas comosus TaxID=4615 RepID=A0A6P5EGM0_ANACO|nr:protein NUCLEAR FUSION DEFECTIVE 6, chloroplastic/mitochondrial-like isoform X2 [Ananas comosus]
MAAATATAARSVLRASPFSLRSAVARLASESGASRSPLLRLPKRSSVASRFFRCPAEMSFCAESLMPMHSATAAALMTSMLSVSLRGYGWLSEGL